MTPPRMHDDQIATDVALVRRLLRGQFPHWAGLELRPYPSSGTANAIYRLGEHLAVRLPLQPRDDAQLAKELRWLPVFASRLPLAIPRPFARGEPAEGYPCAWSVALWLPGECATPEALGDSVAAARELATFCRALRAIDATDGPPPGAHNFLRGLPLAARDEHVQAALVACEGLVDTTAAAAAWQRDLRTPVWDGPPVWVHGDLAPGNLLTHRGRLTGVIDWGGLGVGDPAIDLLPAWNLFEGPSRAAYREACEADEATWARSRGLALGLALMGIGYYTGTNPTHVANAHRTLRATLSP